MRKESLQTEDAGRIRTGTNQLAQALNGMKIGDIQVLFKEATEHRAVLILRGKGLSSSVSDTDPRRKENQSKPPRL